jgi:uncharacterized protein (TIGR00255 family)
MLLSMTGYGRASSVYDGKTITIEVRSLNSKFTDIRFKMPQTYKDKEHEMRKLVMDKAERGKIDVSIDIKSMNGDSEYALNQALFTKYYTQLMDLSKSLNMPETDIMQAILRIPNVIAAGDNDVDEEEWKTVNNTLKEALKSFTNFRLSEGKAMEDDCTARTKTIVVLLEKIAPFESERAERLRTKIDKHLNEYVGKDNIDANRFEQEILYYLEKIDVTEEKVRLAQHCKYFDEELNKKESLKGRKLSFISQEMGREINTLGSKANSSDIQRVVVQMKDELEKIKELVANTV